MFGRDREFFSRRRHSRTVFMGENFPSYNSVVLRAAPTRQLPPGRPPEVFDRIRLALSVCPASASGVRPLSQNPRHILSTVRCRRVVTPPLSVRTAVR